MILKDGQKYSLTKEDQEFLKNKFEYAVKDGKLNGSVRLMMDKSKFQVVERMSDRNGKTSKTTLWPTQGQRLSYKVADDEGEVTHWVFTNKTPQFDKINRVYESKGDVIDMTHGFAFSLPQQNELVWFLSKFCPVIRDSREAKGIKQVFYFKNDKREAELSVSKRKAIVAIEGKILDMDRNELERLHTNVFGTEVPSGWTDAQVQDKLVMKLHEKGGVEKVKEFVGTLNTEILEIITSAIEAGLLTGDEHQTYLKQGAAKTSIAAINFNARDFADQMSAYLQANPNVLGKVKKQVEKQVAA